MRVSRWFCCGNARHDLRISPAESRIPVLVVPTDEELMIARHTLAVVAAQAKQ
ncbi:MAG: hypothetical protein HC900_01795 [Methylacidiphilales bacterium]|nr:hypothetical protein [Candidatus Methylacidiphilales bacterium]